MAKTKKIRVDVHADKLTSKSRTERALKISQVAPSSPLYQGQSTVKESLDTLLKDGTALQAAEDQVSKDEAQAQKSRGIRDALLHDFDASYDVVVSHIEKHAATPGDVSSAGFLVLEKTRYAVVPPRNLAVKFNYTKNVLEIRVKKAPGMHACFVELSPDPVGPTTYKRLDGIGSSHAHAGCAPGLWWVRAASVRGSEMSAWIGPVSVQVK